MLRRLANPSQPFARPLPLPLYSSSPSISPNHTVNQTKENVLLLPEEDCQFPPSSLRFHFRSLTFLFFSSLLFISSRRSTPLRPPRNPCIFLATATCKSLALSVPLPPLNRPLPSFSTMISQPTLPEHTGLVQSIIRFSSPSGQLPALQSIWCQRTRVTIHPTAGTPTPSDQLPVSITTPSATTTTAPACLSMDCSSPEPSPPELSQ